MLVKIGLKEGKAKEVAGKDDQFGAVVELLKGAGLWGNCDEARGVLIYQLVAKCKAREAAANRLLIAAFVAERKIDTMERLDAAAALANARGATPIAGAELESACGVGLVYSEAQIVARIEAEFAAKPAVSSGEFLGRVKKALPFSDGALVKQHVDAFLAATAPAAAAPKGEKKTGDSKAAAAAAPTAPSGKKSKKKALKTALPPIDGTLSSSALAESLVQLVLSSVRLNDATGKYECDTHAVAMVADSIAAVQRQRCECRVCFAVLAWLTIVVCSYASALRAGAVDPRNGIQLPPAKYTPQ